MPYTPTDWVNGATPVNEANLDKLEAGVAAAHAGLPPAVVNGKWLKGVGGAMVWSDIAQADVGGLVTALAAKQETSEKAAANGYASLGSDGKVPAAQLPTSAGGLTLIEDKLLVAAGAIDFQSIPATYRHLELVLALRGDAAAANINFQVRFNNDSGANYDGERTTASGGSAPSSGETLAGTGITLSDAPAASAPAGVFALQRYDIPCYARTDMNKGISGAVGWKQGTATGNLGLRQVAGYWRSNAAINRITLVASSGAFAAGCQATLYGKG